MCGEFTEKYQQGQTHQAKVTMVGSDDATMTFNSIKHKVTEASSVVLSGMTSCRIR